MSFFDRFKRTEENPKKKGESKKDVKTEKKEKDTDWAASREKPAEEVKDEPVETQNEPVEEVKDEPAEAKDEPVEETKKKPVRKPKDKPVDETKEKPVKKTKEKPKMAEKKKADNKVWHITKRNEDGMWQVKAEGNERATKLFKTKAEAEDYVKTLVSNNPDSRVVKHKKTGEFQNKK